MVSGRDRFAPDCLLQASDHRTVQDFRRKVLRELIKIKTAWPDLNYATAKGVLIVSPSNPSIPRPQLVK